MTIKSLIRTIPDYPKPGIQFRDITTLLLDAEGVAAAIGQLADPFLSADIHKVAAVEARGFIFGVAVALQLGVGFIPVRKPGKLPGQTVAENYELEYGVDQVEIHSDAIGSGERVLLVDDLIATGGTAEAAIKLVEKIGGTVVGSAFVVELPALKGRARVETSDRPMISLCEFEGE